MTDDIETRERTYKMLIADDDPAIVRSLADRCAKMGFKIETAANGMLMMIKARRNPPDVLIVDVNMPELDGLSACTRLLDPSSRPIEVLVITGRGDAETEERCDSMGTFYARKGAEFWNNIEAALTQIYPAMADKISDQTAQHPRAEMHVRPRVLVVDDDPAVEKFLSSRLSKYGVDTLAASDAVHGYRIACKQEPTVIIVDNYMPDGDAYYLLHRLRGTPATANIPVIVLSGRKLDELTEQGLRREISGHPGVAQIFVKSFDTDELFKALEKYCGFDRHGALN